MKTKSILIIIKIGVALLFVILFGIIYSQFYESDDDRQLRISNDRNVYITTNPEVLHLDVKCKIIYKQTGYIVQPKSGLIEWRINSFCTKCCNPEDIKILKSQITKQH